MIIDNGLAVVSTNPNESPCIDRTEAKCVEKITSRVCLEAAVLGRGGGRGGSIGSRDKNGDAGKPELMQGLSRQQGSVIRSSIAFVSLLDCCSTYAPICSPRKERLIRGLSKLILLSDTGEGKGREGQSGGEASISQ